MRIANAPTEAQAKVEYIVAVAFVVMTAIVMVTLFGNRLAGRFGKSTAELDGDRATPTGAQAGSPTGAVPAIGEQPPSSSPTPVGTTNPVSGGPSLTPKTNPLNPTTTPPTSDGGKPAGHPDLIPAGYDDEEDPPEVTPVADEKVDPKRIVEMRRALARILDALKKMNDSVQERIKNHTCTADYQGSMGHYAQMLGQFEALSGALHRSLGEHHALDDGGTVEGMRIRGDGEHVRSHIAPGLAACHSMARTDAAKNGKDLHPSSFDEDYMVGYAHMAIYAPNAFAPPPERYQGVKWSDVWRKLPQSVRDKAGDGDAWGRKLMPDAPEWKKRKA